VGATRPESTGTWVLQGQINLRPGATRPLDACLCATRLGNSAPVGHRARIFFTPVAHMARYQIVAGAARGLAAAAPAQAAGREEFWQPARRPDDESNVWPQADHRPNPTNRPEQCRTHKTSAAMHPNRQEQCLSVKRSPAARPHWIEQCPPPDRHQVTSRSARREARERRERRGRFLPGDCGSGGAGDVIHARSGLAL
jgi:hypothetical protein